MKKMSFKIEQVWTMYYHDEKRFTNDKKNENMLWKYYDQNQNEKTTAGVLLFKRVINNCLTCKIFCISFYTIIKLNVNKNGFLSKASFYHHHPAKRFCFCCFELPVKMCYLCYFILIIMKKYVMSSCNHSVSRLVVNQQQ